MSILDFIGYTVLISFSAIILSMAVLTVVFVSRMVIELITRGL